MTAMLLKCCFLVTFVSRSVMGFNLETKGLTVLSGEAGSYFGFTVGFSERQPDVWALVGAPKGTDKDTNVNSGCLNYCAKGKTTCSKLSLKDARNPSNNQPLPSTQKSENMWLGASLDIGNAIGVCGSRWINALSNDVYVMNGMCFEIPLAYLKGGFPFPTILPGLYTKPESEQITSPDPSKFNQTLLYGVSMSGMSIKYDGNEVVVGSPGLNEFAGGIVRVQGVQPNVVDQQTTEAMQGQMYGYSVAVGQFYGNDTVYYAIGGPRDGGTGKVLIYSKQNTIKQTLMGMEAGSYFGAAICFIPKSDSASARLVVGAPMYSRMMGYAEYYASNQEQGIAYVYKNDPNTLQGNLKLMTKLEGRKSKMSRFGAAMANLNDLNKDGYNDLVIGAPFQDDRGAIYIYMGYKNGFYETQMITAAELMKIDSTLSNLVTFGSSLSQQQTDFNNDQHADVVIGAYGSDKAIVMYTNPPITMKVKVDTDLKTDAKGHTVIPLGKSNFTMRVCFDYEGDNIPADVDVVYKLKADTAFKTAEGSLGRVCFASDDGKSCLETATEENFRIFKAQSDFLCGKTFTVVLRDQWDNVRDLFTPVEFEMKYNVTGTSTDECTTTCPVINQFKPDNDDPFSEVYKVEMELAKAGCDKNNDNVCQSNLKLMVSNFRFSEQTNYLVTGTSASFSLDVTVTNTNEPSYNTQIEFTFHSNVSFSELINLDGDFPVSCVTGVGGVACTGYNPSQGFTENNNINFRIVFDGARVQPTITAFPFEVMVTSSSTDTDKNDNTFYRNIDVRSKITMTNSINADPEIFITKTEAGAKAEITVQHSVTVVNDGPSNLLEPLTVKLHYPQATLGGQPVVQPTKIVLNVSDADENTVISCGSTSLTPEGSTNLSYRAFSVALDADSTVDTEKNYDCRGSSGSCKSILCEIGQVMASSFITLDFEYKVKQNLYTLVNGEKSSVTETPVVTQVTSAITKKPAIEFSSKPGPAITKMLPSKPIEKEVEAWVIIVPIIIAIIIIAVIVFVLYKKGFFVRKYRVQMEEAKKGEKAPLQSDMDVPEESATCDIVDDEQEQQKPLTTFTPPSEKKNIQNSKEEEEEKGEPDWAGVDQLMLDLDLKAGNDFNKSPKVDVPPTRDYDTIEDDVLESIKNKTKEDVPEKEQVKNKEEDIPDYAKIDKSQKHALDDECVNSEQNIDTDNDIPDYAKIDKSNKGTSEEMKPFLEKE